MGDESTNGDASGSKRLDVLRAHYHTPQLVFVEAAPAKLSGARVVPTRLKAPADSSGPKASPDERQSLEGPARRPHRPDWAKPGPRENLRILGTPEARTKLTPVSPSSTSATQPIQRRRRG